MARIPEYLHVPEHKTEFSPEFAVADMTVYHGVQRELRDVHVKKLGVFNPSICEPVHLVLREDGTYSLVDGQHRKALAEAHGVEHLMAMVHFDLTIQQEAALHLKLQSARASDTASDKWNLKDAAGSAVHQEVNAKLATIGVKVGNSRSSITMTCATTLERALKRGGDTAPDTILKAVIAAKKMFPESDDAFRSEVIGGLCYLLHHQEHVATPKELGDRLFAKLNMTGKRLALAINSAMVDTATATHANDRDRFAAKYLAVVYNERLTKSEKYEFNFDGAVMTLNQQEARLAAVEAAEA